jgi:hypothetical protein
VGAPLRDAVRVIQALRQGPLSAAEIAAVTGIHWRKVYRLVEALMEIGAPIKESVGDSPAHRFPPKRWMITAQGLRDWLG